MQDQDTHEAALLTAFAQQPSFTAAPVLTGIPGWDAWHMPAPGAGEYEARHRNVRQRRGRGRFIPRKAGRAFRAVLPAWMLPAFTVCLAIPGPFDEAGMGLAALVLLVVRFPRARSAWRGGKTHRKAARS